jgi:hypothetical protein
VSVFYVEAVICCELDNGVLVGCQVAEEHGQIEVVLAPATDLPVEFTTSRQPAPSGLRWVLVGRKFRGLFGHQKTGDLILDFGRYRLRCDRAKGTAYLEIGIDGPESHDLPEDKHLSVDEQIRNAQRLARPNAKLM